MRSCRCRHLPVIVVTHHRLMGAMDVEHEITPTLTRRTRRVSWWLERRAWDRRAENWDHGGAVSLGNVVRAVLTEAATLPGAVAVDLGCGSGRLSIPLARGGATVTAVDISPKMVDLVRANAAREDLHRLSALVSPMERLSVRSGSVDVVVSNYALHHLRDRDKEAVVRAAATWLRPGGRMVVGDMMFGRGKTTRDRRIIRSKVAVMLRRGPSGSWRLVRNVVKFGLRMRERPVSMETWVRYFEEAGLVEVSALPVVAEAAVVVGRKPSPRPALGLDSSRTAPARSLNPAQ